MVTPAELCKTVGFEILIANQAAEPLIQRLEPSRRVAVLMALLGIVIVGLFFVAIVLLGGNWARRLARHSPDRKPTGVSDIARRACASPRATIDESSSHDTIQIKRSNGQTKTDL